LRLREEHECGDIEPGRNIRGDNGVVQPREFGRSRRPRFGRQGVSAREKIPHYSGRGVRLRRSKSPAGDSLLPDGQRVGDEERVALRKGSTAGLCRGVGPSGGGAAVWHRPADSSEDAGLLGIPAEEAASAPEARPVHGHHRPYPGRK
jgi:hypothetical protein